MPTSKQVLGAWGEKLVAKHCPCPKCKREGTLARLPANFKCADLICDFCGYLAQVKTMSVKSITPFPKQILGAAWGPQEARMKVGVYFPLFLVLKALSEHAVFYLPTDLQTEELFQPRKALSAVAKRAGWRGFMYNLSAVPIGGFVKVL